MSGLGAGLARGLAMYGQGRMMAEEREAARQASVAEQQRRKAMDDRQAAMMQAQLEQMQQQRLRQEADAKRQQEIDARNAYEGGYRSAAETDRTGAAMRGTGVGMGAMGAAVDALDSVGGEMQQRAKAPAFTMGGMPMVKAAESLTERVARLQAQQREGEARLERDARAKEKAEDRAYQQQRDQQNFAQQKALITARLSGQSGAGGGMPQPVDTTELMKWRGDFDKQIGPEREVASAFSRLQGIAERGAENMTATDDLAMIFSYMKMLDPGSVVREGEFANAQNTAGVDDRIRNLYNRALSGERLSPSQRNEMLQTAGRLASSANERVRQVTTQMVPSLTARGVNPSEVVRSPFSGLLNRPQTTPRSAPVGRGDVPQPTTVRNPYRD